VVATVNGELKSSEEGRFWVLKEDTLIAVTRLEQQYGGSELVLGAVYEAYGLYEEAEKQFEQLKERDPTNEQVVQEMLDGLLQLRSKERDRPEEGR
jgi:tetratricopeptide (TPR) repeat protein